MKFWVAFGAVAVGVLVLGGVEYRDVVNPGSSTGFTVPAGIVLVCVIVALLANHLPEPKAPHQSDTDFTRRDWRRG